MMTAEEFAALKEDIRLHGQREPCWTHEGQIIDGRNRYRACLELGIEPHLQEWGGEGTVVEFALSRNLHRRHLSSGQKAVIALVVEKHLADEARRRQGSRTDISQKIDESYGRADEQAAALVGSNRQYISDAKSIRIHAPDLLPKVRDGELTIHDAKELSNWSKERRDVILTEMRTGTPLREAVRCAKEEVRKERAEIAEARENFGEGLRKLAGIDPEAHRLWELTKQLESTLAKCYNAMRDMPELVNVSEVTQGWTIKKKQARLRLVRAVQKKLEPLATTLEQEIADAGGFDEEEIANFLRSEMDDFDPHDFGR